MDGAVLGYHEPEHTAYHILYIAYHCSDISSESAGYVVESDEDGMTKAG